MLKRRRGGFRRAIVFFAGVEIAALGPAVLI
jgi:hypothetical protein